MCDRVEHALTRIANNPQSLRLRDDELPMAGLRIASAVPARLVYRVLDNGEVEVVRMLLLARSDSGAISLERRPIDLGDVAADAASSLAKPAEATSATP